MVVGAADNPRELASTDTVKRLTRSVFNRYANATTTTTSYEALWSNSIAAGTFVSDGGMIDVLYSGIFASNTHQKSLELVFASTVIFSSDDYDFLTMSGADSAGWKITAQIIRASNTEVGYTTELVTRGLSDGDVWMKTGTITGLNLTTTGYNLVLNATTPTIGDVTAKFAKCLYHPGV